MRSGTRTPASGNFEFNSDLILLDYSRIQPRPEFVPQQQLSQHGSVSLRRSSRLRRVNLTDLPLRDQVKALRLGSILLQGHCPKSMPTGVVRKPEGKSLDTTPRVRGDADVRPSSWTFAGGATFRARGQNQYSSYYGETRAECDPTTRNLHSRVRMRIADYTAASDKF